MTKSKVVWIASLAAVLATPTTGMAAWWSSNTVTLGSAVQLTGFLADAGRYYRDGYNFAVDKVNEKGGITIGGKSYKLAVKLLDNKSDPRLTLALYERLATKDKVNGLLSAYTSTEALTGSSIAEKHQVPMIQAGGAAGRIISRGYKYVFGTLPTAEDEFRSIVGMLEQLTP